MGLSNGKTNKDFVANSSEWIDGYQVFNKMGWLTKIRFYFRDRLFYEFVKDRNCRILDVGCGTANYIRQLKMLGYSDVYGVEPDIQQFQHDKPGCVSLGDSNSLPFVGYAFDCIYIFGILHHLRNTEEYRRTMDEVDRCLRPGGVIIILEPSNDFVFTVMGIFTRCLSPVFKQASVICRLLKAEKEQLEFFFRYSYIFRSVLEKKNYEVLRDQKFLHLWALVMRKSSS